MLKTLADQETIEPLKLPVVGNLIALPQPFLQRRFDQRIVVDAVEHGVDRGFCDVLRDPGAFDLHPHAQLATALQRCLGAGDRFGHTGVVDRAFAAQSGDGIVDRARVVALVGKPVADLLFGKLATGQQLQPVDVGCASRQTS